MKATKALLLTAVLGVAAALAGCTVTAGPAVYYPAPPPPCPDGYYWSPDYGCVAVPPAVVVPPDAVYAAVNIDGLSLRSCPTTKCGIVASLGKGEQVQVLSHEGSWAHVWAYTRGLEGWVASRYLD
ncbi:SH3 domain-containing protein [Solidesulfovibrio sp.]|jgi:uncharacterized protein YgiM (DUF1202 family)|uniref:SH3 domain-containing protein n=1 Tax=Solidesulfovibrio sp. TaxID=2910990 RepID=UPI000EDA0182|nr:SH3 domain-containing protein [Solidesulfovibrio sp.]MEA5087336.1 SH3 domain-containing protein [Solidesulfovibrio sp.]HCR14525.1 peptide-binding protein [Desulfovibrio sp.]HML61252.1 SH3 domain-containing protein [Solidesulfovibrio sp.]